MFTTIVVGTDGSATATSAVARAVTLARTCGARLHLVSAYKPLELAALPLEVIPTNVHELIDPAGEAKRTLEDAHAKAKAEGIDVETHAMAGDAACAILDVADAVKADCIVVGNRGMAGKARFLLGSVPNKVSHHAPCTVMIVRTVE